MEATVIEQQDGFRMNWSNDATDTIVYLKKSAGWTKQLVNELAELLSGTFELGFNANQCELEHLDFEE